MAESSLDIKKVGMVYKLPGGGSVEALKDVSFTLGNGRILTLLGPSGCGKTTLLNILAGFLAPTSGEVSLNGKQIKDPGQDRGMVFQQGALFEWLSVAENVGFGLEMNLDSQEKTQRLLRTLVQIIGLALAAFVIYRVLISFVSSLVSSMARSIAQNMPGVAANIGPIMTGLALLGTGLAMWFLVPFVRNLVASRWRTPTEKATRAVVDGYLDTVGLAGFGDKAVYELSGGMQQRVALARCLANDPDVILMDEPLGALDALTREKMQGLILKLWKETGKTIILVTHSVEEALFLGDKLFVMAPRPGRIEREYELPFAEQGLTVNPRELKTSPEFIEKREEILSLIWEMEEEIMGRQGEVL